MQELYALSSQGADALERANNVRIIVFDKTGTLTKGRPTVTDHQIFLQGKECCAYPTLQHNLQTPCPCTMNWVVKCMNSFQSKPLHMGDDAQ
jgi:magnesium-transporting ATPase (P-type)